MKSKIFLTSIIALAFACPAFAVDGNALIENGDTCNVDNLGTSTNNDTANIEAIWTPTQYQCSAGQYLYIDANVAECRTCSSGSFCGGGNYTVESHANDILACSSLGDGSYTLSDDGSDENSDCYKTCSASCTQPSAPAHSTNVVYGTETASGEHHYGSSCNAVAPTCSMTFSCVSGYHKRPDLTMAQGVVLYNQMLQMNNQDPTQIPQSYKEEQVQQLFDNWETWYTSQNILTQNMTTQAIDAVQGHQHEHEFNWQPYQEYEEITDSVACTGFEYVKTISGNETCKTLTSCDSQGITGTQINCDVAAQQNEDIARFRQSAQNGEWFVTITNKNIYYSGVSRCDTSREDWQGIFAVTSINGYNVSTVWIDGFLDLNDPECVNNTEFDAAEGAIGLLSTASTYDDVKTYMGLSFGYAYIDYICEANNIGLAWYNDTVANNGTQIEPTNDAANQCSYNGTITVPTNTMQKAGYIFGGWKLRTNTTPAQ